MIEVKEILRRHAEGQSLRRIARDTGLDRKTVRRYVEATLAVEGSDEERVQHAVREIQVRPPTPPSEARRLLSTHEERIRAWLLPEPGRRALRLTKVHTLLARQGVDVTYTTLWRWAHDALGWRERKPTVRVDDPPAGEEAQADFGKMGTLFDPQTGKPRALWCLIVTLTCSRMQFVWPTFEQTTAAVCEGLDAAWAFFGGVPARLVVDNAKSMVVTAHATAPRLNDAFAEYAQARGLFLDPARVRRPKDKPRVENQVPFARESWLDGETLVDIEDARRSAYDWSTQVAEREHGTTRRVVREHFEAEEKGKLQPPPTSSFDVPRWTEAKVHPDHHVQVSKALYSVPTRYIGATLRVREDRTVVRLYRGGELIKNPPAAAARPALHGPERLPARQGWLRDPEPRPLDRAGPQEGRHRRRLPGAPARRPAAVVEDAAGLPAREALRPLRRLARRRRLCPRPRVRRARRPALVALAQARLRAGGPRRRAGRARPALAAPALRPRP